MDMIASSQTKRFLKICQVNDVVEDEIKKIVLPNGHAVALYKVEDKVYVTDDICSHGEASLSEDGVIDGFIVECTWHFGKFDIRDGKACAMPCEHPLKIWKSEIRENSIYIEVDSEII